MFIFLIGSVVSFAQESAVVTGSDESSFPSLESSIQKDPKVKYEYKKEDYFDFDSLSVKGELLSPGDLSSKTNRRVRFEAKKYIRKDFDQYIIDDLLEVY